MINYSYLILIKLNIFSSTLKMIVEVDNFLIGRVWEK